MAKKKNKQDKEIRKLLKRARKAKSRQRRMEEAAVKLEKKLKKRDKKLSALKVERKALEAALLRAEMAVEDAMDVIEEAPSEAPVDELMAVSQDTTLLDQIQDSGVVVSYRNARKAHAYLRDRYEHHLAAGSDKKQARGQANRDMVEQFGEEHGFSSGQLEEILT